MKIFAQEAALPEIQRDKVDIITLDFQGFNKRHGNRYGYLYLLRPGRVIVGKPF
jgi:hypothetical protein